MIYEILYAEDVPHYGLSQIEADNLEQALQLAKERDFGDVILDSDWSSSVCCRIVQIQDEKGDVLGEDIALDGCFIRYGGEEDRLRCEAAEAMLTALEEAQVQLGHYNEGWPDDQETAKALDLVTAAINLANGHIQDTGSEQPPLI